MKNTALLIVDVQTALVNYKPFNIENTLSNIKALADSCRENKTEVIYVQHDEKTGVLEPFSSGWEIHSSIDPKPGEKIFRKTYNSAFKNTTLDEYLKSRNINTIILVGMQTEYCIDTTCRVAFENGYKLLMPENTNTTFNNGSLSGRELYEYHNFRIFKDRFAEVKSVEEVITGLKKNNYD